MVVGNGFLAVSYEILHQTFSGNMEKFYVMKWTKAGEWRPIHEILSTLST